MIGMKVVRNVILNIDLRDQPFMMHHSPLRSRQKISRIENFKDLTYLTDISDLVIECFCQDESCQKWYFKQLISQ